MKFNIGDLVKVVNHDQIRYGRIKNVYDAFNNDWYSIHTDPETYTHEDFIIPISEWEYIYRCPVVEEDISSVNDSEMDQILAG